MRICETFSTNCASSSSFSPRIWFSRLNLFPVVSGQAGCKNCDQSVRVGETPSSEVGGGDFENFWESESVAFCCTMSGQKFKNVGIKEAKSLPLDLVRICSVSFVDSLCCGAISTTLPRTLEATNTQPRWGLGGGAGLASGSDPGGPEPPGSAPGFHGRFAPAAGSGASATCSSSSSRGGSTGDDQHDQTQPPPVSHRVRRELRSCRRDGRC